MRESAPGTLTAAICACTAYGSLAVTDFRGFRHFGIIGGAGMLLTWVASYTLLPATAMLFERVAPLQDDWSSWPNRFRGKFGYPFLALARRFHRELLIGGAVTGVLATAISIHYLATDPLEYDNTHIRNAVTNKTSAAALLSRIEPVVGLLNRDGRAILTDRMDQVEPLVAELEKRKAAAPPGRAPFDRVVTAYDLLPSEQPEKLAIVAQIKDRLERARRLHAISDEDWAKLEPDIPKELRPLGIEDLPADLMWPFTETNGTRGRVVYIVPTAGESLDDVHYLLRFADSFRETRLPNDEVIYGTGDPVVFSDIIDDVRVDAPKTMATSMLSTLLVILIAFRGRRAGWIALGSMLLGVVWLVALLAIAKIRINFLNFVALPISVGVGADYAVNLMKRHERDQGKDVPRAVIETGGAVVLCSMTTLLGYGALTLSINGAVKRFGVAGALGEATMLLAAMLILPSLLLARPGALRPGALRRPGRPVPAE
jgi:predicted RND superfamily exporter protein